MQKMKLSSRTLISFLSYKSVSVLLVLIGLYLFFTLLSRDFRFANLGNLNAILRSGSELGIVAIGMAFLLISGEFDLSVGSQLALCSLVGAVSFTYWGFNPYLSLILAIFLGFCLGVVNGTIVTKLRISSFIATLGTMWVYRGIVLIWFKGYPISFHPEIENPMFGKLFIGSIGVIPAQAIWFLIICILFYILLQRTSFGNRVLATGGNEQAARMMGIRTDRVKILCFGLLGAAVGLVGVMQSLRLSGAYAVQGEILNMQAIGSAVVGGTSIFGGVGTIPGAAFGALIIQGLQSGLLSIGLAGYWYQTALGLILITSVSFLWIRRRRGGT